MSRISRPNTAFGSNILRVIWSAKCGGGSYWVSSSGRCACVFFQHQPEECTTHRGEVIEEPRKDKLKMRAMENWGFDWMNVSMTSICFPGKLQIFSRKQNIFGQKLKMFHFLWFSAKNVCFFNEKVNFLQEFFYPQSAPISLSCRGCYLLEERMGTWTQVHWGQLLNPALQHKRVIKLAYPVT